MYVVARIINGREEYMREESGDDCFSDDLGNAILYEFKGEITPLTSEGESIIEVIEDEEGCIYIKQD